MVLKHVYANVKNGVNLYTCAYMQSGEIACVMECGMDREKEKIVTIKGTKGKIVVRPLHRAFQMTVTTDAVEEIEIPYVVDDFYGEIKAFVDCYQQGNIENDHISHAASLRCAEIMEMIQNGFDKPICQSDGKIVRRKRTSEKAGERDRDLDGGEEFRGLLGELAQLFRAPVARFLKLCDFRFIY